MIDIDAIRINFNQDDVIILNLCLAFLMFAVAMDIRVGDFKNIFKQPRLPLIGLFSQLVLLPLLTLLLVWWFDPPATMALGMILIGACPGGNVSNFAVHLAKGNTALSVMLTSINTIGSVLITPIAFMFWSSWLPKTANLQNEIAVETTQMIGVIFLIVIIPLVAGMYLNHYYHTTVRKIYQWIQRIAMFIFMGFVIVGLLSNYDNIINYVGYVFWVVLVYNGLALLMGYYFAKLCGSNEYNARAISIETGIQNTGLALVLVFNFFDGIGGMALIAAWWGIWHLISGMTLALFWQKRPLLNTPS